MNKTLQITKNIVTITVIAVALAFLIGISTAYATYPGDPSYWSSTQTGTCTESCGWTFGRYDTASWGETFEYWYITCCYSASCGGSCRSIYDGAWDIGYWCSNAHFGTGLGDTNPATRAQSYDYNYTVYNCSGWSHTGWTACDPVTQTQNSIVSPYTHSNTSPVSCSTDYRTRECCPTPSAPTIAIPSDIDADTDFAIDWSFTNTDNFWSGYSCDISHANNYDNNGPWTRGPFSALQMYNSPSIIGNISFAGSYEGFPHQYDIACSHATHSSTRWCPPVSNNQSMTVEPAPLDVTMTVSNGTDTYTDLDEVQVVDTLRYTVDAGGGVPFEADGEYEASWVWTVNGTSYATEPWTRTSAQSHYVDKRIAIEGVQIGVTVTVRDQWGRTGTASIGLTAVDDRNPQ